MKTIFSILSILFLSQIFAQSDTLNKIDSNQLKQGYWVIFFDNSDKILEEGRYKDDMREGVWKQHLENGTISSEITYVDDEPNGYAKIYYPNGQISEEGIWKNDVWVGEYKAYYPNGKLNYKWNFSEDGKRTGKQEYYHENGQKMIEGNWDNGQESGVIKHYNEQGQLTEEQTFDKGEIKPELTVKYEVKKTQTSVDSKPTEVKTQTDSVEKEKIEMFRSTGERKLFNHSHQLTQEGYFENGKLIKGKKYFYNSDGQLIRIDLYKNGQFYKSNNVENKN